MAYSMPQPRTSDERALAYASLVTFGWGLVDQSRYESPSPGANHRRGHRIRATEPAPTSGSLSPL